MPAKVEFSYARCEIVTNLAGMVCPLCRRQVQPGIGHVCYQKAPARVKAPKPVRRQEKSHV